MKGKFFMLQLVGATFAVAMIGCNKSSFNELAPATSNDLMQAPVLNQAIGAKYISDNYIVVMKDDVSDVDSEVDQISRNFNVKAKYRYKHAIKGFAGVLPAAAIEALSHNPKVAYIEQDQEVHIVTTTESNPTWGLDRIDQQSLPLSNSYTYDKNGYGVDAYIIDCGILLTHNDFGGRAVTGVDEITINGNATDGNGHGTHVAGTVGGNAYGVAKGVRLIAVRVLDNSGSGSTSGVIAGIDWVTGNHTTNPAVANMSLGGGASTALDDAVRKSIADGVTYCIAAGNSTADAGSTSPARVTEAVTVGATDINDKFAYFSNYGSVVDISAPGVNITSDWNTSSTATNTISGTSMATPHVTGAAALYLAANPSATPAAVQDALKANGTANKITSLPGGTVNLLLYTGTASSTPPPAPLAPLAPTLSSPSNGSSNVSKTPNLIWYASSGASTYNVEVATDAGFSNKVYTYSGASTSTTVSPALSVRTTYYWRVSASNANGTSPWSTWSFRTGK